MTPDRRRVRWTPLLALLLLLPALAQAKEGGFAFEAPKAPEVKAPKLEPPEQKGDAEEGGEEGGKGEDHGGTLPPQLGGERKDQTIQIEEEGAAGSTLTLEEIVNHLVTTASRQAEGSLAAPAWIITLTASDLRERGYHQLSDLLDDLPGMDVIRPRGDTYVKTYWRGYRNTIGSPWLLMMDGVVFNQLWLNETEIMAAFPLSSVERVEVVYGPASAVYGPNAAMGVINVITRKDAQAHGAHFSSSVSLGTPQHWARLVDSTKSADFNALYKGEDFRVSVTGRFDFGVLDPSLQDRFEWLKSRYSTDRALWGGFVDFPGVAGSFRSPSETQAVDARLFVGGTEIAAQMFRMVNGSGLDYPADKLQSRALYTLLERDLYLRHTQQVGDTLTSTSLVRYRESNVDPPTTDVERTVGGQITFQYWQSTNWSFSAHQDFALAAGHDLFAEEDALTLNFGFSLERRNLQRAYTVEGGDLYWDPSVPLDDPAGPYPWPKPIGPQDDLENHSQVDALGGYLLSKYRFLRNHSIDLGLRLDYDAFLGELNPTFRGGYVGQFLDANALTVKLLYGQAVQEPTWRELFGAWNGTGANPGLRSERSQTLELDLGYGLDWLALYGDAYWVQYKDAIISTTTSGQNIGKRRVLGADLSATAILPLPGVRQLRAWAYYSIYFYAKQSALTGSGMVPIGDLAKHKLWLGATLELNSVVALTALGRCASARNTVATNPLGKVAAYCDVDANLLLRDLFTEGVSLSFKVTNLLDTAYDHPGIAEADSGDTPGKWNGSVWEGSQGYYNSLLPQPGRAFMLSLGLSL